MDRPAWQPGDLTPSQLIGVATDALADLAGTQAAALNRPVKQVAQTPEFQSRIENIIYCATGIRYGLISRGE